MSSVGQKLQTVLVVEDNAGTREGLAAVLRVCHVTLNFTLLMLVCVHAAAALKHHVIDRDTVLWRMFPAARPRRPSKG